MPLSALRKSATLVRAVTCVVAALLAAAALELPRLQRVQRSGYLTVVNILNRVRPGRPAYVGGLLLADPLNRSAACLVLATLRGCAIVPIYCAVRVMLLGGGILTGRQWRWRWASGVALVSSVSVIALEPLWPLTVGSAWLFALILSAVHGVLACLVFRRPEQAITLLSAVTCPAHAAVWTGLALLVHWAVSRLLSARQAPPLNCCAACAYDLTGNVSGVCPECGTPLPLSGKVRNGETP